MSESANTPAISDAALRDGLLPSQPAWHNWSGKQTATPTNKCLPRDEDELRRHVREASRLRVVGAGHSFSPLVPTSDTLLSLDAIQGLISHDAATHQARLWAGTRLFNTGPLLHDIGQSMPNLGDVDRQSLAGALSTATHGTGITLPCIAAGATALQLVTANGDLLECSREQNAELLHAAGVSLGMLGVISQVTLQNIPAYRLQERVHLAPLDELLPVIQEQVKQHRHFELWAFPHSRLAVVKTLDMTEEPVTQQDHGADSDDAALKLGCELTRTLPILGRGLQKLLGLFVRPSERVNWSHKIFAAQRNVRFNEMEYQVPADVGVACLDEICHAIARNKTPVFIPVEFRFTAPDNFWLSPFQGGADAARCSISLHQYHKQDYRPLFALAEPILQRHGGRPHWGKLHTMNAAQLHVQYPDLARFLRLRAELDPTGKFLNPYLRQLFGINTP